MPHKSALRLRLEEGGGIALCILACALLAALVTYNPTDPSFNTATNQPPTNLLGTTGAFIADTLLQGIGLGATVPALILVAWGWRFMSHRLLGHETWMTFGMRVAAILCLLPVSGALLAAIPLLFTALPSIEWPTQAGIGGGVGHSIAQTSIAAGMAAIGPAGGMVIWLLGGLLAALLLALGTGLRREEWLAIWRAFVFVIRLPGRLGTRFVRYYASHKPQTSAPASPQPVHAATSQPATDPFYGSTLPTGALFDDEADEHDHSPYSASPAVTPASTGTALVLHGTQDRGEQPLHPPATTRQENPVRASAITPPPTTGAEPVFVLPTTTTTPPPPTPEKPARSGLLGRLFAGASHAESPAAGTERAPSATRKGGWELPPLNLLRPAPNNAHTGPSPELLNATARMLEQVLADYGVQGKIVGMSAGPVVTLYELEPAPGIRSARIIGLADDVARSLSVLSVRIATVPGRNVMGIEVPNQTRETVYLSELLNQPTWKDDTGQLPLALGKDIAGDPVFSDLARMPHLLVAGTTGSGKSVGVNAMILSLLYRHSPDECRLIMIDPKVLELSIYDGIPHLLTPVVTEPPKAVNALKWVVREMDRRYRTMAHMQVRNIAGYNARAAEARADGEVVVRRVQTGFDPETGNPVFEEQSVTLDPMPYIVVIIDEMADLMMTAGKEIDACVQRLAQKARAAGIHVIMATQRPSVDVITGTIKANFPTRISFQVISKFDSRTILGEQGAEQLLGQGDMLFMQGGGRITRVHGPFVADSEVEQVVSFLKEQGEPIYDEDVLAEPVDESASSSGSSRSGGNENAEADLYSEAVDIVTREGKASTSFIQRHLSIGYNRAAKLIEQMEKEGIISRADHVGRRKVLVGSNRED
ncbi:DNA translocase FtsK [Acetobacter ghanensis]|uniref:DNA translocase FtsK n=1 Tax=Acetobacter ghanensis TaxID=431306 RepID=A0A0U5F0L3_9PROT|nr:DNA translocase FtsK [Acetobacter ghanensis]NHO39900.1 cell division protein FtsK [Acetobacter ghanensis]GBQ47316.1 cell division protein FtsK [Acetobacter ghanensis DSM 18895]CEF53756.1 cell divisionFtsK/SpoIIIE [Acetobacter ghanensis]